MVNLTIDTWHIIGIPSLYMGIRLHSSCTYIITMYRYIARLIYIFCNHKNYNAYLCPE